MIKIQQKLLEITAEIKKNNCSDAGLFLGHSGIATFLAYANKYYNDPRLNAEMENSLQQSINLFEKEGAGYTFSSGFAGVCWGINNLVFENTIEADVNVLFEDIEPYIIYSSENDLAFNFFDFLHGGLGSGVYFIERLNNPEAKEHLKKVVLSLKEKAIISDTDIYWINTYLKTSDRSHKTEFNLGLSHGIPSIVWFLSKCYENNIENEKCEFLLKGSINWLVKQKTEKQSISLFPSHILDNVPIVNTRLGWCYGDLGIASTIWQTGKALRNEGWKQEALNIMLHSCERKSLLENNVKDAGICHGTAGVAHIFNRFYKETGIKEFDDARWYWLEQTLKMAKWEDGLAGYKAWQGERGWQNEYGLLEGIAGIGLVLLGFLTNDVRDLNWDKCLLLS